MPFTVFGHLDFQLKDGRGLRTDQIEGAIVESIEVIASGHRVNMVNAAGAKASINIPKGSTHAEIDERIKSVAHLLAPPVVMHVAWSQSDTFTAGAFLSVAGAAVGHTSGLIIEAAPSFISASANLWLGIWVPGDPSIEEINTYSGSVFIYLIKNNIIELSSKTALTVDSVEGNYYHSVARVKHVDYAGLILSMLLTGKEILVSGDVAPFALDSDPTTLPEAKLPVIPKSKLPPIKSASIAPSRGWLTSNIRSVEALGLPAENTWEIRDISKDISNISTDRFLLLVAGGIVQSRLVRITDAGLITFITVGTNDMYKMLVMGKHIFIVTKTGSMGIFNWVLTSFVLTTGSIVTSPSLVATLNAQEVVFLAPHPTSSSKFLEVRKSSTGTFVARSIAYTASNGRLSYEDITSEITLQGLVNPVSATYRDGKLLVLEENGRVRAYDPGPNDTLILDASWREFYPGSGFNGFVDISNTKEYLSTIISMYTFEKQRVEPPRWTGNIDTPVAIKANQAVVGNKDGSKLDFVRQIMSSGTIPQVEKIPTFYNGAVLYLPHDEREWTGVPKDLMVTPGFLAPDFYGFSDGTAIAAIGSLTNTHSALLSWLGGDLGTKDSNDVLLTWEPYEIASHSESWLNEFSKIKLGTVEYTLGASFFQGGITVKLIESPPTFADANAIAVNLIRADGTSYWGTTSTITHYSGLYRWDNVHYELMRADSLYYRGSYNKIFQHNPGDLVRNPSGDYYVCLADSPVGTLLSNGAIWFLLWEASKVIDITFGGGYPQVTELNKHKLHADHSVPRLWINQFIPAPGTPATATSILFPPAAFSSAVGYSGALRSTPNVADSSVGDIYYNTRRHSWYVCTVVAADGSSSEWYTRTLAQATSNKNDFPSPYIWLSERSSANDAANFVPGNAKTAGTIYLFYNTTTGDVEGLVLFTPATNHNYTYEPVALMSSFDNPVISVQGHQTITADNYEKISIDHAIPRAWIEKETPVAKTPAKGASTAWPIRGKFLGVREFEYPPGLESSHGDIVYRQDHHYWAEEVYEEAFSVTWTGVSFDMAMRTFVTASGHPHIWLGERANANDAASYVVRYNADTVYLYYNTTTRTIHKLNSTGYVIGKNSFNTFAPYALANIDDVNKIVTRALAIALAPEILHDSITVTGNGFTPTDGLNAGWQTHQRMAFTRPLAISDDAKILSIELEFTELGAGISSNTTLRAFGTAIPARMFRELGDYESSTPRKTEDSADWFVRQPDYTNSSLSSTNAMKITYGRYITTSGVEGMHFAFTRSNLHNTTIINVKGRIILHP